MLYSSFHVYTTLRECHVSSRFATTILESLADFLQRRVIFSSRMCQEFRKTVPLFREASGTLIRGQGGDGVARACAVNVGTSKLKDLVRALNRSETLVGSLPMQVSQVKLKEA